MAYIFLAMLLALEKNGQGNPITVALHVQLNCQLNVTKATRQVQILIRRFYL